MTRFLSLCGGFLLAVLWFDLMFDMQVAGAPPGPLPEAVLASVAAYYARVTTAADPMGRLIGVVMLATLAGAVHQLARGSIARRFAWPALAACTLPVALALFRIVPDAVRLGARSDPLEVQSALARSIYHGHLLCFAAILAFCILQLTAGRESGRRPASAD
jgi:hypothetical protein